jgi:hypothetical protein
VHVSVASLLARPSPFRWRVGVPSGMWLEFARRALQQFEAT